MKNKTLFYIIGLFTLYFIISCALINDLQPDKKNQGKNQGKNQDNKLNAKTKANIKPVQDPELMKLKGLSFKAIGK